ncbi:MAG TPA: hypothetical protein VLI69_07355 [Gammaproteobacteria bacterium]|nr:hypothetical protein [Gammaproteobacteria bacterium]
MDLKKIVLMLIVLIVQRAVLAEPLIKQTSIHPKNLNGISFKARKEVETIADNLSVSAHDPYAASLPLIVSAELGDKKRYKLMRDHMLVELNALQKKPTDFPQWMRNESFKGWMLGRVLLAADAMTNTAMVMQIRCKLLHVLEEPLTKDDSLAFHTWAEAYFTAMDKKNYRMYQEKMRHDTMTLSDEYKAKRTHEALSNVLWACVMDLYAAANAEDRQNYELIKQEIRSLTGTESVSEGLEKNLLRTADSNDYPAWAMARVRLAAAVMHDADLYSEIEGALTSSTEGAKKADAKAEYALAIVDNQLAMVQGN